MTPDDAAVDNANTGRSRPWPSASRTGRYLNLEVEDTDEDQRGLLQHLARAAAFLGGPAAGGEGSGGGCLVHCAAGVSRSSTVVAACLMAAHGMTLREALAAVRERRPIAWPNEGLVAELAAFEVRGDSGEGASLPLWCRLGEPGGGLGPWGAMHFLVSESAGAITSS